MDWTKEQKDAIEKRGSNILVAAAAGSGKTTVLVERIIRKIIDDKVDIDKLLVCTFTNAAASEMRERILESIYKKLDENPDDEHLKKQIILLGKASISTIHSFCLEVIRNNFYELGIPANFKISSEEEVEIIKLEAIDDLFERLYEEDNKDIKLLVNTYSDYRSDEKVQELVLNVYKFIQSTAFPEDWLEEKISYFDKTKVTEKDFGKSLYGKVLVENLIENIDDGIRNLSKAKSKLELYPEFEKQVLLFEKDIRDLGEIRELSLESWDLMINKINSFKFDRWSSSREESSIRDYARGIRDQVRKKITELFKNYTVDSEEAYQDLFEMYDVLNALRNIVNEFSKEYFDKKMERNIVDFNDIEHLCLKLLLKKNEDGSFEKTDIAKKYEEKFEEIAVDEYQDSNEVQETIIKSVSNGKNIFMVGDVKQSIYKFRQAMPELFLDKYDKYSLESPNDYGLKIQLFNNFRSRKNVLDLTNLVFKNIMSKKLGDIDYTEEEYLNYGANYEEFENGLKNAEMFLIETKKDDLEKVSSEEENDEFDYDEEESDDNQDVNEMLDIMEKEEIEAKFVAKKIKELISNEYEVFDKKEGKRKIKYKDIVILLRSTKNVAGIFEKELLNADIPVFSDVSNEYIDTIEIQTMLNCLKVIDNPTDDISLVATLRSKLFEFTDNELLEIRLINREVSFYEVLKQSSIELEDEELKNKVNVFLNKLEEWQNKSSFIPLSELIWEIYEYTGFYNYSLLMPNGNLRVQNLKMFFERAKEFEKTSFKGLFNFIKFIEKIKSSSSDMSAAKIIGENENVVRIMSIHKSKGLEFPVVFLSNVSKKINLMDLSNSIILHRDLGFGPEYINYESRIKYHTLAKEAIKIKTKNETISEEMRVLYVALTRAKEKLIITGTVKDAEKYENKINEDVNVYNLKETNSINYLLLKKYVSYLDWINLILVKNDCSDIIKKKYYTLIDVLENNLNDNSVEEDRKFDFENNKISDENFNKVDKLLEFNYKYKLIQDLLSKTTVSKIKEESNKDLEFEEEKVYRGIENIIPSFINNEAGNVSAKKGTLMHMIFEKLNFRNENISKEDIERLIDDLILKRIILNTDKELINVGKIQKFTETDLFKRINKSKEIEKEKAFCMKMSAGEIKKIDEFDESNNYLQDEYVLVQGIIDLYFVDENDKLVLVDYKTDYVENNDESKLVEKYKKQLELYKRCLENALNKKVDEIYIYSTYLNKEIKL